ncbi:MAG: hypothetical protein R3F37_09765 [Candidatus Competibacteraceae bacterium]
MYRCRTCFNLIWIRRRHPGVISGGGKSTRISLKVLASLRVGAQTMPVAGRTASAAHRGKPLTGFQLGDLHRNMAAKTVNEALRLRHAQLRDDVVLHQRGSGSRQGDAMDAGRSGGK